MRWREFMDKPIVVQKYGGSSVADPTKIQHVAARVVAAKERGCRVVVVVSAMGDTTDDLLALAGQITEQPPRRELDMLISAGERISMALLSMAIQQLGHEAISFTGSQSGILTNDQHFDARIIEVRPVRIQDELSRDKIVIVAGYQGMSYKREITTLGRGGSDTTAVALAAALDAQACEIYSDVDGVYEANPRVVLDAQRLDAISYDEMELLARSGAQVLHAEAVAYARAHQIALYARGTLSTGEGTLVRKGWDQQQTGTRKPLIAARRDISRCQLHTDEPEALAALLVQHQLPALWTIWEGRQATLLFCRDDLPHLKQAQEAMAALSVQPPLWSEVAAVSLVRDALDREPIWLHAGWRALAQPDPIPVWQWQGGPSRLTFVVPTARSQEAEQRLYDLISAP